jgi:hypothetical protein
MTEFDPTQFVYDGMYLRYQGQFVARFKRGGKAEFVRFLVKNFTVEEYFAARETLQPVEVLETRGFVSAKIKSYLKLLGFAPTAAGKEAYLNRVNPVRQ